MQDLEAAVAAAVWRDGPMSAYRVREAFRASLSPTWSSSAGTIYPVVKRLVSAGILSATSEQDRRGTQQLSITSAGREAVQKWLLQLPPDGAVAAPDPSRVRLQFLGLVAPRPARKFLAAAKLASEDALARLEAKFDDKAQANWPEFLATLGAAMQIRARLNWLQLISGALDLSDDERDAFLEASRRLLAGAEFQE